MAFDLITPAERRHSTLQKGFNLRWPLGNVQGESSPNGADFIYICPSPQDLIDAAAQALHGAHATLLDVGLACTLDRRPRLAPTTPAIEDACAAITAACRAAELPFA